MIAAVAFLTRIPLRTPGDPDLSRAAAYFPLVGLLVGAVAAATRALADLALPPLPATLLAITAAMLVTGALHEDGLADSADALGAHTSRQRRLEILKDPRVGTFGALALIVATTLTTTTIAALETPEAARALVISHVLARWAILPVSRALEPARPGGAGALLRVTTPALVVGTVVAAALALAVASPQDGAAALLAAAVATATTAAILNHALGGITGDGYGATAKLAELAAGTTLVALWT
jgi:adenosylcobinamide-GDP ribazoletransferase